MEWIKTADRLPDEYESVLICIPSQDPFPLVREGFLIRNEDDGEEVWYCFILEDVVDMQSVPYWMPMPKPPEENEKHEKHEE